MSLATTFFRRGLIAVLAAILTLSMAPSIAAAEPASPGPVSAKPTMPSAFAEGPASPVLGALASEQRELAPLDEIDEWTPPIPSEGSFVTGVAARSVNVAGALSGPGSGDTATATLEMMAPDKALALSPLAAAAALSDAGGSGDALDEALRVTFDVDFEASALTPEQKSRLRLALFNECDPEAPETCDDVAYLDTEVDEAAGLVSALVHSDQVDPAPDAGVEEAEEAEVADQVVAVAFAAQSIEGDYTATPIESLSSYEVSGQTGSAESTYAIPVPTAAAGPEPQVALHYSSGQIDGMNNAENNQGGTVGLGWTLMTGGSIKRSLEACAVAGANQDRCLPEDKPLTGEDFSINLNGVSSELVRIGTSNDFRVKDDPMWRVSYKTGAGHGRAWGEWWEVTTPEGTRWQFGTDAQSTRFVPVFFGRGANVALPPGCDDAFKMCDVVQQWDLRKVIDTFGNQMDFAYRQEINRYNAPGGVDPDIGRRPYVQNAAVTEITYGGTSAGAEPNARVVFSYDARCLDGSDCRPGTVDYPDAPSDLWCPTDQGCSFQPAPTYWTHLKLVSIATQLRDGDRWVNEGVHDLSHAFPDAPRSENGAENNTKLVVAEIRQRPTGSASAVSSHFGFSPIMAVDRDALTGTASEGIGSADVGTPAVMTGLGAGDSLTFDEVWLGGQGAEGRAESVSIRYSASVAASAEILVDESTAATLTLPATAGKYATVSETVTVAGGGQDVQVSFTSGDVSMASIQFEPGDTDLPGLPPVRYLNPADQADSNAAWLWLPNRRNVEATELPDLKMPRIKTIENEIGGVVVFDMGQSAACPPSGRDEAQGWIYDCYGTVFGDGGDGVNDDVVIWKKYKVLSTSFDPGAAQPVVDLAYAYSRPVWAYAPSDDNCSSPSFFSDFRGHNEVTVTDELGSTKTRYLTGIDGSREGADGGCGTGSLSWSYSDGTAIADSVLLQGQMYEMRRFDTAGTLVERERVFFEPPADRGDFDGSGENGIFNTAGPNDRDGAWFVAPAKTETTTLSGGVEKTTAVDFTYDAYGNVVTERHAGDEADATDDRTFSRSFAINTGGWIINLACRETVAGVDSDIVSQTRWGYDGIANAPGDSCTAPTKGGLTDTWAFIDDTATAHTVTTLNQRGQVTAETDPNGNTNSFDLDPVQGWVVGDTNPLGWERTYVYDERGNQTSLVDVNTNTITFNYDGYSRMVAVTLPENSTGVPSYAFSYDLDTRPVSATTKQLFDDSRTGDERYLINVAYVDGMGRDVQAQARAQASGARWISAVQFDEAGQLKRQSTAFERSGEPGDGFFDADWSTVPLYHEFTYDARGEMVRDATYGGGDLDWDMTYSYAGWTTAVADEQDNRVDYTYDAWGNLVQVDEYGSGSTPYSTATSSFDAADRLRSTTDDDGNTTTIGYDQLGRRRSIDAPSMGAWEFRYDPAGNMIRQRDGRNTWLAFDYDALNRVTTRSEMNEAGAVVEDGLRASYDYDGPAGRDRLHRSTSNTPDGPLVITNAAYNAEGNVTEQVTEVPGDVGGTFRQKFSYGPAGQQLGLTYPANNIGETGEVATTTFDWRTGLPVGLSSSVQGTLVDATVYGPDGQRRSRTFGDGGAAAAESWDVDATTERTQAYRALVGGTAVVSLDYGYDARGNTTRVVDNENAGQTICFGYDAFSRLTSGFTGDDGCNSADLSRGADPFDETYDYNSIHTFASKTGPGDYTYGEGTAGPYSVTSTSSGNRYAYDANGNQTLRTVDGATQLLAYDADNRLSSIAPPAEGAQGAAEAQAGAFEPSEASAAGQRAPLEFSLRRPHFDDTAGNSDPSDGKANGNGNDKKVKQDKNKEKQSGKPVAADEMLAATPSDAKVLSLSVKADDANGAIDVDVFSESAPVDGVAVDLYTASDDGARAKFVAQQSTADGAGTRFLDVSDGCYVLVGIAGDVYRWDNGTQWKEVGVCVDAPDTQTLVSSVKAEPGSIAGTVSDDAGKAEKGIYVDLFAADEKSGLREKYLTSTASGHDGEFVFVDLDVGCYVTVTVAPDGWLFADGSRWQEDRVCVTEPGTPKQPLTVEATAGDDSFSGVVRKEKKPVEGVSIDLFEADKPYVRGAYLRSVKTDAEGRFSFDGLAKGCYVIVAIAPDGEVFDTGSMWWEAYGCVDGTGNPPPPPPPGPSVERFLYGADGERIVRVQGDTATVFVGQTFEWNSDGGSRSQTSQYFLGGRRVAMLEGGDLHYTFSDHINSTAAVASTDGSVVEVGRYRPWGEVRGAPVPGTIGFAGQRPSTVTGLLDYGPRFYDPALGGFVSPDSRIGDLANNISHNRYAYALQNPATYYDPTGEWGLSSIKSAVKKVGGAVSAAAKKIDAKQVLAATHVALDVAGLVPGLGEFADGANALLYLAEGDYANAALSAAAMIPIAGGAATAARMCKKFCDSAVSAVAKGAKEVGASAVKRVKNRLGRTRRVCNSFVPGTLVLLASGALVPIEAVVVGDEVLATDPVTGESAPERVTATITGEGTKTLVEVSVKGETVVATDEHPFWEVATGSWVDASDLSLGDRLLDAQGIERQVYALDVFQASSQLVHNLTVENLHVFYVGQETHQFLVHNSSEETRWSRMTRQTRWRRLAADPKTPRFMRGWVRQELNRIATGRSTYIRNVPGYDLAHQRGREAAKGFGYDYADPKSVKDHKLQHRLDDKGRANRLRPPESC